MLARQVLYSTPWPTERRGYHPSSEVEVGDVATLYGDECPAEHAADLAGTISYELLCAVSPRVPRVYKP